uniref:Uncharacterized protein n=1 Tax=Romanomermis culicivorax TaxID=13658 RepID=A0A915IBP5_ROMCU
WRIRDGHCYIKKNKPAETIRYEHFSYHTYPTSTNSLPTRLSSAANLAESGALLYVLPWCLMAAARAQLHYTGLSSCSK